MASSQAGLPFVGVGDGGLAKLLTERLRVVKRLNDDVDKAVVGLERVVQPLGNRPALIGCHRWTSGSKTVLCVCGIVG